MRLTLLDGPAAEPLDLDDVKAHLRLDTDAEDAYLQSLIATSRLHIEAAMGLALITQRWRWQADRWPANACIELMTRPVQAIEAVGVVGPDAIEVPVPAADYTVDLAGSTARIAAVAGGLPAPSVAIGGVRVTFRAGFGDAAADVPDAIRHALKLLVAHWYEVRDPGHIGAETTRVPAIVSDLLAPFRVARL